MVSRKIRRSTRKYILGYRKNNKKYLQRRNNTRKNKKSTKGGSSRPRNYASMSYQELMQMREEILQRGHIILADNQSTKDDKLNKFADLRDEMSPVDYAISRIDSEEYERGAETLDELISIVLTS